MFNFDQDLGVWKTKLKFLIEKVKRQDQPHSSEDQILDLLLLDLFSCGFLSANEDMCGVNSAFVCSLASSPEVMSVKPPFAFTAEIHTTGRYSCALPLTQFCARVSVFVDQFLDPFVFQFLKAVLFSVLCVSKYKFAN